MTAEIETFIRDAAQKRGINPDIAVKVARSEGGVDAYARRGTFDTGSSWWPFQLHYGGAGYEQFGSVAGMGTAFTRLTGWQPGDPKAWRDSTRYALNRARVGGWGDWYGAADVGVSQWDGIDRNALWLAAAEPWDYEAGVPPVPPLSPPPPDVVPAAPVDKVRFDPQEPAHTQEHKYDCSQDSLEWAMWSLGRRPTDGWMEAQMIAAGVMNTDDGLLDGSGASLAAWIGQQYGEFGYLANNEPSVSFDWAALEGGHAYPILLGGHRWSPDRQSGHWSGCWGYDQGHDVLLLSNPAPGWAGVGQVMSRQQFDDLGPFSAVRIWHPDLLSDAPPPPPPVEPLPPAPGVTLAAWKAEGLAILDGEDQAFRNTIRAWISRMPV